MKITPIVFPFLLAGIPAFVGAYLLVGYFGHKKASTGVSGLVFGIAMGAAIMYFMPEGRISHEDYIVNVPWILGICIVLGAAVGFIARRRDKISTRG